MPRTIVDETPRPSLGAGRAMLDLIAELSLGPAAAMAFVARDTNRIAASDGRAAGCGTQHQKTSAKTVLLVFFGHVLSPTAMG